MFIGGGAFIRINTVGIMLLRMLSQRLVQNTSIILYNRNKIEKAVHLCDRLSRICMQNLSHHFSPYSGISLSHRNEIEKATHLCCSLSRICTHNLSHHFQSIFSYMSHRNEIKKAVHLLQAFQKRLLNRQYNIQ